MKFRKKPIVVDARQFRIEDLSTHDLVNFGEVTGPGNSSYLTGKFWISTLEGPLFVSDGDWIITGIQGEKYPCKPDIFEATYEAAV